MRLLTGLEPFLFVSSPCVEDSRRNVEELSAYGKAALAWQHSVAHGRADDSRILPEECLAGAVDCVRSPWPERSVQLCHSDF